MQGRFFKDFGPINEVIGMQEEVGRCIKCGKTIFCLDGFLNGVVGTNGQITCFSCTQKEDGV
jgi:hypothetical protein